MTGQTVAGSSTENMGWLNLAGRVCVVTGAAGGIGDAIAAAFARAGAFLALLDRDADACRAAADRLRADATSVAAFPCDITDPEVVAKTAAEVEQTFGGTDVLVNNAGLLRPGPIDQLSIQEWNATLAVNLTGYFLCAQAFGRQMIAKGRGSLVHVASVSAHHPQTFSGAYSPSKAAVSILSRQLAAEWGPRGLRSNVVSPGMIRTPLSKSFYDTPGVEQRRSEMVASRRIGRPEDIASVVLFLASDRAGYVNGAEIVADGGFGCMLMDLVPRPGYSRAEATSSSHND
jgi:NAD(P)-dependent dehydrogenase (short-subunit alcohol dehydrogenase family)